MKRVGKITSILIVLVLTFTLTCFAKAQAPTENMKTFFDSDVLGMRIQVNATAEARPAENITAFLRLNALTDVRIQNLNFNFSMFGFVNGTHKVPIPNITPNINVTSFSLSNASSKEYNFTFSVPEHVWDTTYGEITLTYDVTYSVASIQVIIPYENLIGFTMTHVENTYVEQVEQELEQAEQERQNLNNTLEELKQVFSQLCGENLTKETLNKTFSSLQGNVGELDNTRMAVTVLAITTVFFVATTVYLVVRKPKQYL